MLFCPTGNNTADNPLCKWHFLLKKQKICPTRTTIKGITAFASHIGVITALQATHHMPYNDYDRGATAVRSDVSATAILINNSYMSLQQICNAANKSDYMSLHFVGRNSMTLNQLINREQRRLLSERKRLENLVMELPSGTLSFGKNVSKGKKYYKWYVSDDSKGQRSRKIYLRREHRSLARQLARKSLLQARLKDIDQELNAIDAYMSKQSKTNFWNKVIRTPGIRELIADDDCEAEKFWAPPEMAEELRQWMYAEYETNNIYPEQKNVPTDVGIMVRSKSEAIIVMLLTMFNIPFRYECKLEVGGHIFYPDFTIRHPITGETFYWEHAGRLDLQDYRMDFLSKLRIYMNNGIIPDNNLILTFESPGHPLDIAIIMDKLEEFFFTVPKELRNDY